jgi:hypothetical protein
VSLEELEAFVFVFLITGQYVIGAFEIVLLLFLIDFVIIAIAVDNVRQPGNLNHKYYNEK